MIRTNDNPEAEILHVGFGRDDAVSDGAQEAAPGVFVEFDTAGQPIGVEITSVRWRSEQNQAVRPAAE